MTARASAGTFCGEPSVRLAAGPTSITFLPTVGMLGASLRHERGEHLSLRGGPATYAAGHTTGLPLLAPWANRLASDRYRVGRRTVDLTGVGSVGRDGNGLPMHGTLFGRVAWEITYLECDTGGEAARLAARLAFGEQPDHEQAFPFPHDLGIEVEVKPGTVVVTTLVTPTGRRGVPVSFGWHPYFRLPGVRRRADLVVDLPARHHLELDEQMIPTRREVREATASISLDRRTFDDAYRLGRDRTFSVRRRAAAGNRAPSLSIEMGEGYTHAQVYAPAGRSFVAFEPMTAAGDALVTGAHATVAPGETFRATFTIRMR